jgi:hypothetical protein
MECKGNSSAFTMEQPIHGPNHILDDEPHKEFAFWSSPCLLNLIVRACEMM